MRANVIAALLLAGAPPLLALDPRRALTQYALTAWQAEQGLPQNTVQAVEQTRDGYLWLGTQEGLVRFDGISFTVFDAASTPAFQSPNVQCLLSTKDGALWIGTEGGGLVRLVNGAFKRFGAGDGLASPTIRALHEDHTGVLRAGTYGGGLCRFGGERFACLTSKEGLPDDRVSAVTEDASGAIYVGTNTGVLAKVDAGDHATPFSTPFGGAVVDLLSEPGGSILVAARTGLFREKNGKREALVSGDAVSRLLVDRDGNLFAGTGARGLLRVRASGVEALSTREGMTNDRVRALHEDREGNLWVGTEGGGLVRLKDGKVVPYGAREGLPNENVYGVLAVSDGTVWAGTRGSGVAVLRDHEFTTLTRRDGLPSDIVFALLETRDGKVYLGTEGGGLAVVEKEGKGRARAVAGKESLGAETVFSLAEGPSGEIWIGTAGAGLARLAKEGVTRFGAKDGLASGVVFALLPSPDGSLLVGTYGAGLYRFDGKTFEKIGAGTALEKATVFSLARDGDGALWIGTYGSGLFELSGGRLGRVTAKQGLFNDIVYAIADDGLGNLYMTCNKGIFRARKSDLSAVARGQAASVVSTSFGAAEGMRDRECNGAFQPAATRTSDGRLFFPTIRGLVAIDPAHLKTNVVPPPVVVSALRHDGREVPLSPGASRPILPPGRGGLEIAYAGLSFSAPERVLFRYRLEGFDRTWVDAGSRRTAFYTNLPPGDYVFRVVACNEDGVFGAEGASLPLRLRPHFWQTRAFDLFLLALAAALGWGMHRLRLRRLRERFEVVLLERSRLAREMHDTIAQGLTAIGLQLENAEESFAEDPEEAKGFLARAKSIARSSLAEARRSIWALRPEALERSSLPDALRDFASSPPAGTGPPAALVVRGRPLKLHHQTENEILRIAQEALTNAWKYAGARRIDVSLTYEEEKVSLTVRDDGKGFEAARAVSAEGGGFGLVGMKERARTLGGEADVKSAPGEGTVVTVSLPRSRPPEGIS